MPKLPTSVREEYIDKLVMDYPSLPRIVAEQILDCYEHNADWMIAKARKGAKEDRVRAKTEPKSIKADAVIPGDLPAPPAPQAHA